MVRGAEGTACWGWGGGSEANRLLDRGLLKTLKVNPALAGSWAAPDGSRDQPRLPGWPKKVWWAWASSC